MFKIASRIEGKLWIMCLSGEVDDGACKGLTETLEAGFRRYVNHVLLNLQDLTTINRSGQLIILKYLSQLKRFCRLLIVCHPLLPVQYAFSETGVDRVMPILPTLQKAKVFALSKNKY